MVKSLSTKITGLGKGTKKGAPKIGTPSDYLVLCNSYNYNFGPAATKALPASFPVNLEKFLMKRPAKSLAFSSH
jgi:hypothetical protein